MTIIIIDAIGTLIPFAYMIKRFDSLTKSALTYWVCALVGFKVITEVLMITLCFLHINNWVVAHIYCSIMYFIVSSILLYGLSKNFKIISLTIISILTGLHLTQAIIDPLNSTPIICGGLIMFALGVCSIVKPNRPMVIMWITKGVVIYYGVSCLMWLHILNPKNYLAAGLLNALTNIIANYCNLRGIWTLIQR